MAKDVLDKKGFVTGILAVVTTTTTLQFLQVKKWKLVKIWDGKSPFAIVHVTVGMSIYRWLIYIYFPRVTSFIIRYTIFPSGKAKIGLNMR